MARETNAELRAKIKFMMGEFERKSLQCSELEERLQAQHRSHNDTCASWDAEHNTLSAEVTRLTTQLAADQDEHDTMLGHFHKASEQVRALTAEVACLKWYMMKAFEGEN